MTTSKTFRHPVAGSTVILPNGSVLAFGGKPGGFGVVVTDNPAALEMLGALAALPGNPVELVSEEAPLDAPAEKPTDPSVAASIRDAAANTVRLADPKVAAMQANLQTLLGAEKAA